MDQNTVKRKIATALAVCLLAASAAPAVLAEDTGIALMEATPSEPTRAALKLTRITPGNGTLEVELTGTVGQNVTVDLTTMDEEDVASQTVTLSASGSAVVQFTGLKAGQYAVIAQYVKSPTEKESAWQENIAVTAAERDAQAVRSDYAQADGEQRAGGENYPEAERQPHASADR